MAFRRCYVGSPMLCLYCFMTMLGNPRLVMLTTFVLTLKGY